MTARALNERAYAANVPSPSVIRQIASQIRRGWTSEERERRRALANLRQQRLLATRTRDCC